MGKFEGVDADALNRKPPNRPRRKPELPVAEIPIGEFREAQRDPKVVEFLVEAKAQGAELKDKGLIHL